MQVYFVRHGESEFNRLTPPKFQFPDTPLSDHGKTQARAISKRFAHIPVECIITSTFKRANDTAKEIEKIHPVTFIENELFRERTMPTSFRGKSTEDEEVVRKHNKLRENYGKENWHLEDEENFHELLKRAQEALNFIVSQNREVVAVVTHGYFLQLLVYCIIFKELIDQKIFLSFRHNTDYSNTGLTLAEYKNKEWKLVTWNDHSHLGE